jgi:hypothetical protein
MRTSDPRVTNSVKKEIDILSEIDQANDFYVGQTRLIRRTSRI